MRYQKIQSRHITPNLLDGVIDESIDADTEIFVDYILLEVTAQIQTNLLAIFQLSTEASSIVDGLT